MRDSISIYRTQADAIRKLDPEDFKEVMLAIFDYGMDGKQPECTGTPLVVFQLIKPLIDKNNTNYENAKKRIQANQERTVSESQANQERTVSESQSKCKMLNVKSKMLNDKEKDILSGKPDSAPAYPYREVVEYLNSKIGTSYKASSRDTRKHIKARFDEGYTLEDFQKVIDNKVSEWGKDPDMVKYLRPATLFGTKFESYLNQKTVSGGDRKNQFNRFHQREYDFESLERDLLRAKQ